MGFVMIYASDHIITSSYNYTDMLQGDKIYSLILTHLFTASIKSQRKTTSHWLGWVKISCSDNIDEPGISEMGFVLIFASDHIITSS